MFTWLDYGKLGLASGLLSGATVSGCSKAGINDWKTLSTIGLVSLIGSGGSIYYYLSRNKENKEKNKFKKVVDNMANKIISRDE